MVPRAESQYLYPHITGISFKVTLCQRNIYIQNKCLSSYCVAESKASFRVACEQAVRGLWHRGKNRGRFNKKILASFTDVIFTVRHLSKYAQKNITSWPHLKSANQHLTPHFGPFCDVDAKKKKWNTNVSSSSLLSSPTPVPPGELAGRLPSGVK